jgi:hypothetical protein
VGKLTSVGSGGDKCLFYLGMAAACVTGVGMPSFVLIFGDLINGFGEPDPEEMQDMIRFVSLAMLFIGVGLWIFSYLYYSFLLMFSEIVARKTRVLYFHTQCVWLA